MLYVHDNLLSYDSADTFTGTSVRALAVRANQKYFHSIRAGVLPGIPTLKKTAMQPSANGPVRQHHSSLASYTLHL